EELVAFIRVVTETAQDIHIRIDEILALHADGLVLRRTVAGKELIGGGPYENRLLALWLFDASGRLHCHELFDSDHDDEALVRFAALTAAPMGEPPPPAVVARSAHDPLAAFLRPNAATAAMDRLQAAFDADDWTGVRAVYGTITTNEDRRRHAL